MTEEASWPLAPLGLLADLVAGGTPDTAASENWSDVDSGGIPWLSISDMSGRTEATVPAKGLTSLGLSSKNLRVGAPGTLLFAMYASVGEVAVLPFAAAWNQAILGMQPRSDDELLTGYLFYALKMLRPSLTQWFRSNTQNNLNAETVRQLRIPLPPVDVQRRLADFLDRELAEIDAMDAELNHLIQTLQERRSASVESVLVNSGRRTKLGYFVDTLAGYAFPANRFSRDDRDTRLLRGVNIKPHGTDWAEAVYWSAEQTEGLDRYVLEPGDVVLGMDRPFVGNGTRVVSLTRDDLPALLLQRVLRLRPLLSGSPDFLRLLLMTKEFEHYATPETTGISVPHISETQVLDFPVTIPSAAEQRQLAEHALSEIKAVDGMIADTQRLKALLAERRSTLITDVVTGKKAVPA